MGCGASKNRCLHGDCGCVNYSMDNYGEVGKASRCGCGHSRGAHAGLTDAAVDDREMLAVTQEALGVGASPAAATSSGIAH